MQITQHPQEPLGASGFTPIPTRIRDVPPLIVEPEAAADPNLRDQVMTQLHELATNMARTHRAAAEAYLSQGAYPEALSHLEACVTFAPEESEYHNQLGYVRYIQGDDRGAVESFEHVLSRTGDNPDSLFNLGMVLFGQGDHMRAEDCFRRAIECGRPDAELWNNRGVCLHQMGCAEEGRACFQRALELDANNEDAVANLQAVGTAV
ncbi:MAG: tetratricopeptide repeat protein [Planctomycetota bacterium]